ncbi:MAG TPA: OmpH family outer membrane protein [Bacteroidota bacterium]|nr:OmpH family outer membrane protein [Bacteroidota bacterium]
MNNYLKFIGVMLFVVLVSSAAQAQARIGYVDSEVILRELPEAQKAQKDLEAKVKSWQEELQKMSDAFQKEAEDYQKKQAMMQPAAKEAKEKELAEMQQKAREYYAQKLDPRQGEAVTERERLLAPIREKILKAIEAVAKEENVNFVFDKANDAMLLYADAKFDLTYRVLDRLKRGASTPARSR